MSISLRLDSGKEGPPRDPAPPPPPPSAPPDERSIPLSEPGLPGIGPPEPWPQPKPEREP